MYSDSSSEEYEEQEISSLATAVDVLATPFRALFSKQAQRAYLSTLLYVGTSLVLFCVSVVAYWIFYYEYVPQIGLERAIHLQFGDSPHPWGTADLGSTLVSGQPYDVTVTLDLPRTPANLAAGNFMLDLALLSRPLTSMIPGTNVSAAPIASARRPAILTYSSPLVDTANRLTRMPLYLVGWQREAETLRVQMLEQVQFARGWRNVPDSVRLELQSEERMQIYQAKVVFKARFTGLRYLMYKWRLSSFLFFTSMFWTVSMVSTSLAWLLFASALAKEPSSRGKPVKTEEGPGNVSIKQEADEETDPFAAKPLRVQGRGSAQSRVKSEDIDDPELSKGSSPFSSDSEGDVRVAQEGGVAAARVPAGTGTGLESAEARGVQRRRSHIAGEAQ